MKRFLSCALIALLVLSMLPAGALAKGRVGIMFAGDEVTLGPKLKGVPVEQIEWSSSDASIATAEEGRIGGLSAGRATVTASYRGKSADCSVVVLPKELRIPVGEIVSLPRAGREKYYVEDKSVAAISKQGQLLGIEQGTTRLGIKCGKQRMIVQVIVSDDASAVQPEVTLPTPEQPSDPQPSEPLAGEQAPAEQQSAAAELDCAAEAEQIVLVDYESGSSARLSIHEKQEGVWKQFYSCGAYVGRNGIGKTKEGDGKTPTGTYNLTQPFGIKADPGAKMDYTKVTKYHYWCGASGTKYYNQLVDEREVDRKHTSSDEYLIDYKGVYNYCMFIDYNASGESGKGSCIFLHCKGSKNSTAGCIAVDEKVMKGIIQWAKPGCKIVIR